MFSYPLQAQSMPESRRPSSRTVLFSIASIAALASILMLSSCARGPGAQQGVKVPPVPVEVSDVQPRVVREQFHAVGSIDADESVQIVSEVDARVVRMPFEEGAFVPAGSPLAQLDDRETAAQAARTAAQLTLAKANADRATRLSQDKMISQSELDDVKMN